MNRWGGSTVVTLALALAPGCFFSTSTPVKRDHRKQAPVPTPVRTIAEVDFENRRYVADCLGAAEVTVKRGEFEQTTADGVIYFSIGAVVYGDVTGDGADEALVLTLCSGGGTGEFTGGSLYTVKDGRAAVIARLPEGDRAAGGISDAWIAGGALVVERFAGDDTSGACCPVWIDRTRFTFTNGALVADGAPARRRVDDPTPPR